MDPRVQSMANVLVNYSVAVRQGDWVVIQSPILGEPLADACVRATLAAGGNPLAIFLSGTVQETMLREASDTQLKFISPAVHAIIEQADVSIGILAPSNTRTLASVDPSRMAIQSKAMEPLLETYLTRAAKGALRWTAAQYPTEASAQDAGMSLREYEDFVYSAGLLDQPDPVQAWRSLGERHQRLIDYLKDKSTIQITGPGTDLSLSVAGRTWINDRGKENFPGGEVFTGPVEDSIEGVIEFTYPAYLQAHEVTGVNLEFEHGVVVNARATSGGDFLQEMLDMDEGARRLGEFAFGTNPGIQIFTKNTLFDEKIGGTLHMALGRAYPGTGGTNVSALHWDMVYNLREGSEVRVDEELFSRNGELCLEL